MEISPLNVHHEHDLKCDRCELIPSIFEDVESTLKDLSAIDNEEKNEMEYVISQSKKKIMAWKGHLLRDINQDEARLNLLRDLDSDSVLVVLDWAMKFLPRKYRESQSDWFGKRGISWHIRSSTCSIKMYYINNLWYLLFVYFDNIPRYSLNR